mgnify:CR=1 FL=1
MDSAIFLGKLIIVKCLKLNSRSVSVSMADDTTEGVKQFSATCSELAEGPLWHSDRCSLLWVNILGNTLHERKLDSDVEQVWELPVTPSSLALDGGADDIVWVLTNSHLCKFDLSKDELTFCVDLALSSEFRTNDGSVGPDGKYWFGTMKWQPEDTQGKIFSVDTSGTITQQHNGVAIPNTFCWINDEVMLLSDSFKQECYAFNTQNKECHRFISLKNTEGTPDGGAVDSVGNIWIALWGAGKVVCYTPTGEAIKEIALPVLQPSSCCFGGSDLKTLFITSAKEGLENDGSEAYNLAGFVFSVDVGIKGLEAQRFNGQ